MTLAAWDQTTWGDVVDLRYGKALRDYRDSRGPVAVFGTNGQVGFTDTPQAEGPGVVVGRKGAYRGVHYAPGDYWVIDTAFYVVPKRPLDMRWAYFALQLADINGLDSGSAIPSTTRESFAGLRANVPPLAEQQAIAEVLGALDDKIAANMSLVSQLEQISRTLILSTPVTDVALGDVVEFHNRRRIPLSASQREARPGVVPYYGANGQMATVDEPIFDEPLVLLGEDGSVVHGDGSPFVHYIWGPAWVNNHAHVLTGLKVSTELLSVLLAAAKVDTLVTGAVQPKLSMGNAKRITLRVPEASHLTDVERQVSSLIASRRCLSDQTRTLAATRDTLLPQLMSGRLRVRDAEEAASRAGA